MAAKSYRVLTGLSYPSSEGGAERRVEPRSVVIDIPPESIGWLLAQGHIEEVEEIKP